MTGGLLSLGAGEKIVAFDTRSAMPKPRKPKPVQDDLRFMLKLMAQEDAAARRKKVEDLPPDWQAALLDETSEQATMLRSALLARAERVELQLASMISEVSVAHSLLAREQVGVEESDLEGIDVRDEAYWQYRSVTAYLIDLPDPSAASP